MNTCLHIQIDTNYKRNAGLLEIRIPKMESPLIQSFMAKYNCTKTEPIVVPKKLVKHDAQFKLHDTINKTSSLKLTNYLNLRKLTCGGYVYKLVGKLQAFCTTAGFCAKAANPFLAPNLFQQLNNLK
jgi:hypothetical protein